MLESGIFCSDLDHTLGRFSADNHSSEELRENTHQVLTGLRGEGFKIVLTTSGSFAYAQRVLEKTGVRGDFDAIFDGERIFTGSGKLYLPVAEHFGLDEAEARRKMIVTGDLIPDDLPVDIDVVTVIHPQGYRYSATLLADIIEILRNLDGNNFRNAFDQQYTFPGKMDAVTAAFSYQQIRARRKICEKVEHLGYEITVPVVRVISAPEYLTGDR